MRVVVIGRTGQLARALQLVRWPTDWEPVFLDRAALDLAAADVVARFDAAQPDIVINAAAYNAVDRAEDERALAWRVNGAGPGELAAWCAERRVPFVHVSTDYVFDGRATRPYREDDATLPISAYGASKLAGEEAVRAAGGRHLVVRTSWLYWADGRNFATAMLGAAETQPRVRVVADQVGTPGYVPELASGLVALLRAALEGRAAWGLYHVTGGGQASRAVYAEAVFEAARRHGLPAAEVERISSIDWPTPARRPAFSALDCARFSAATGLVPRPWRESVEECVAQWAARKRSPCLS
jgi:dTDP-4-dehydrorhamnose reductase